MFMDGRLALRTNLLFGSCTVGMAQARSTTTSTSQRALYLARYGERHKAGVRRTTPVGTGRVHCVHAAVIGHVWEGTGTEQVPRTSTRLAAAIHDLLVLVL